MTKTLSANQAPILSAAAQHEALLEEVLAPPEHRGPWTTMPASQA
jgi:hypothetical protein